MKRMILLLGIAASASVGAEQITDYAYGVPVDLSGTDAFYQVALPQSVYQGVTRSDLGDVRVFNGAGEVVPYAWRPRHALQKAPESMTLTLFPLKTQVGNPIENAAIHVQRGADGAISVDVTGGDGAPATVDTVISGYLIDLQNISAPPRALEFDWDAPEGFAGNLRIDASDDLSNWSRLVAGAPLVSLEVAGQRLQQKRVELPRGNSHYLRLSWAAGEGPGGMPVLTSARAEFFPNLLEPPRVWMGIPAASGKSPGDYEFGTGGHMPIDRVRVELPEPNTVAQIELLSRNGPEQKWRSVLRGVAWRLRQSGAEIVSPDFSVNGVVDRDWLLRVDARGGGIGAGLPVMHVSWVPHHIVFAARGNPPFQLVYGNREAKPAAYPIETLIPAYNDDTAARLPLAATGASRIVSVHAAATLAQQSLGGDSRRQAVTDWKRISLWGVLVFGVALLAGMAWRLVAQLGKTTPTGGGNDDAA